MASKRNADSSLSSLNPETIPDPATKAIETPLSSPMGTMRCLYDLTPSGWIIINWGGSYYSFPCLIPFTGKDWKTLKGHSDVPTTSSWNDPRDFAKPVKAISLPQDVPSTSNRRLIELENQVQRLMEAHLAPKSPV
ncbi:hypothetical protein Tco_1516732 [Tanacetum coccineum]